MRFVGLDPGQTGACVVVGDDGATILAIQAWTKPAKPKTRKGEGVHLFARRLAEWIVAVQTPPVFTVVRPGDVVALEAQHVNGPHASLVLATWSGRAIERLPTGIVLIRPLATTWRAKVFRDGRMTREVAKRFAIAAAAPHLAAFGAEADRIGDVSEAWAMARYARFYQLNHPSVEPPDQETA